MSILIDTYLFENLHFARRVVPNLTLLCFLEGNSAEEFRLAIPLNLDVLFGKNCGYLILRLHFKEETTFNSPYDTER